MIFMNAGKIPGGWNLRSLKSTVILSSLVNLSNHYTIYQLNLFRKIVLKKAPLSLGSRRRLPSWLKTSVPSGENFFRLRSLVQKHQLHTVCESASCPNIGECWGKGTLTLMILGDQCSRACRFCDVPTGQMLPPDDNEPRQVAEMLSRLKLSYVVITSVDRDDLPDGGASHWAKTIEQIHELCPDLGVEILVPDFKAEEPLIEIVCVAQPDVFAHNIETVESLQKRVRPQCRYEWSLRSLTVAARQFGMITKSSIMLGHGETRQEVIQTMTDLWETGCRLMSIGQYLQPTRSHLEVVEYIHPDIFTEYKYIGEQLGFDHVESGPLVRSSFRADQQANSAGIL
jgi:lipoyl synthase